MAASEIHLIALRLIKHSDRQSILSAYTLEHGAMAFAVAASGGRTAARTRALTMPLSMLTAVADVRPGREIPVLRNPMPDPVMASLHSSPIKQMVAMFVAEFLWVVLRETQADTSLYRFLRSSVMEFDAADTAAAANFHIAFLYGLSRHLGIEPDTSTYSPGRLFDLRDGVWRGSAPVLHHDYLAAEDSAAAYMISRMTMENMGHFRLDRAGRRRALEVMMEYYSMHYVSLRNMKSLDILRSL